MGVRFPPKAPKGPASLNLKFYLEMSFTRTVENFICENCSNKITGNGFTNHCPVCLWSKHVDFDPGDRQNPCRGLMEPVGVEVDHGEYYIKHKCVKCGALKRNKKAGKDDFDLIVRISSKSD